MNRIINVRVMHDRYEASAPASQEAIALAFQAAADVLKCAGFTVNMADPSEELVAAITHLLIESGNDLGCADAAPRNKGTIGDDETYAIF